MKQATGKMYRRRKKHSEKHDDIVSKFLTIYFGEKNDLRKMIKNTDGPWLMMVQLMIFRLYNDSKATHNP